MPRNGRPPSENPRKVRFDARITEAENEFIEQYATSHNLTKTQVIVKGLECLKKREKPTPS